MVSGTLTIYSASAGSGKTYKLTGIYLSHLFNSRYNYRKILAVTFTNKATAEMKKRILDQLYLLGNGEPSGYLPELIKTTGKDEAWIRTEAKMILISILNDFSRFSVSTIDHFFQKILRAFARDIGLHSGFTVEIDHSSILAEAVDEMIASAYEDKTLIKWLTEYAKSNIEDGKSWNLKGEIIKLAGELFKEKYKLLSADERLKLEDKEFLLTYIQEMTVVSTTFEKRLKEIGKKCRDIYSEYELSDDMFHQKSRGIPSFLNSLEKGEPKKANNFTREILDDPPNWCKGNMSPQLQSAVEGGFENALKEAISFIDDNLSSYKTANAIRSNIYALGILSDVLKKVHQITSTENRFILSDAGEILYLITANDQAPFIYEKVGNRYENYMIDEFQDTSIIQWSNFRPLIENSMAGGYDNIVVGDVKQSIYRWRNSDWSILGKTLTDQVDNERILSVPLNTNWRSCENIIKFNNTLFSIIPAQLDERSDLLAEANGYTSFKMLYAGAVQVNPCRKENGYVRLDFIKEEEEEETWKEIVKNRLPKVIEQFQDKGYRASDIGILVRSNREGASVLETIIDYSTSCSDHEKAKYNFDIVSNESLLLSQSDVISFIIATLLVLNNEEDIINRARMLRFYLLTSGKKNADKVSLYKNNLNDESALFFPDGYVNYLNGLRQLPLFEVTESIIGFFGLGKYTANVVYLNTFQDYVLDFSGKNSADIQSFLNWWETDGKKKSVVLPEHQDAIKVLTIHKSKGLEFKVVIIPYLSWNIDPKSTDSNILWANPEIAPFNKLGIVPVKFKKELQETIFCDEYNEEKYSIILDNLNLLYVAMTRSVNALYAFLPDNNEKGIASEIKNALTLITPVPEAQDLNLNDYFNSEIGFFELGEIPFNVKELSKDENITSYEYIVKQNLESLKLKLHGENYFSDDKPGVKEKINYGKLMHGIFENIIVNTDIHNAVRKTVNEGKIPETESAAFEAKIESLINSPLIADWFQSGNKVLTEAGILLPTGIIKRPDRVIFMDGKTIIIDFKFGIENPHYIEQIRQYRDLVSKMGFIDIESYIWYVDSNKIITA